MVIHSLLRQVLFIETYSKLFDAASNLLVWNSELPENVGNLNIRLKKKDIKKIQNILWYIAHSELWKD